MNQALYEVRKSLKAQAVVWLEGAHLSHEVKLTGEAGGLRPAVEEIEGWVPASTAEGWVPASTAEGWVPASTAEGEGWWIAEIGPHGIHSEVKDRKLLELLDRVARDHADLYGRRYGLPVDSLMKETYRVEVTLFADRHGFLAFKRAHGHDHVDIRGNGYFQPPAQVTMYRGHDTRQAVAASLLHELTHFLNWHLLGGGRRPGLALPPWLDEGMCDDLSLSMLGRKGLTAEPLGPANLHYGRDLGRVLEEVEEQIEDGSAPSLPELLEMDRAVFLAGDGQLHYILSALWVRYLLAGDLADGFRAYLASIANGGKAGAVQLTARLGRSWPELENGFRGWLGKVRGRLPSRD